MFENEPEDESDITEEEVEDIILSELAKEVSRGNITDDNPSYSNGLTSLEKFIKHYFEIGGSEDIQAYKDRISAKIIDLEGGWNNYDQ
jgi:hypothetical protein